ncbi:MAG TPA: hypothetical protein PK272_05025 [Methanoregulaceae archaeon]|nr:hypothetical protein [Methanoregulaceae archaeon]HNJ80950.1 hypothetical protein [Methanoregulaceae archaeon]HNO07747.1 hypothetical protein [Methanoregulaceae archaeon]
MNREFLTRLAAMARKMGAPPFLQRVLTTFVVRSTLVVEGLAGIIKNPPVVQYPEPGSSNRMLPIPLSKTPVPLFSRQR